MIRKTMALSLFVFFVSSAYLPAKEEPGYVLLDKFTEAFRQMAESGSGGREAVTKALQTLMIEARQAKDKREVDPVFFGGYIRVLQILRLATIEDPARILAPLTEKEIKAFIEDVKGEKPDFTKNKIGQIAEAIAEEIISLHLYLDTKEERTKLWKEYEKKSSIRD